MEKFFRHKFESLIPDERLVVKEIIVLFEMRN